ncbi:MAG: quinone-dependent dihydroorotate dehydrogenase [Chthoniobacterales bacterium]
MKRDLYPALVRPFLFSLAPETAHHLAVDSLEFASRHPLILRRLERFQPEAAPRSLFGLEFRHRIGLAAGFDKNGVALPAWEALGFAFVEIGTVTARAQPGNPKPRIFRYPAQQALINRLGFNNDGADVVAERLARLRARGAWPTIPIGINLGKSKATPLEQAADDYLYSFQKLQEFADYIVLNVSSPNTPDLRALQEIVALSHLLGVIEKANRNAPKPVLLKIAPDLATADLDDLIRACEQHGIAGLIATNTTLDHSSIAPAADQAGGLSGGPLREKATAFVRAIRSRTSLPIIGVGGIVSAADAREKFEAGASLVQVYTGYVYGGPRFLRTLAA